VNAGVDDGQLGVTIGDIGRIRVPHHVVDMCSNIFVCCGILQGVSGGYDLFNCDGYGFLPLIFKSVVPQVNGSGAESFLLEVGKGVSVPFHGGAAKALGDVGFDFFFAAESDGVLDALDEVVDVPDVGIRTYLDDVSFAFSLLEFRTEEADLLG